MMDQATLLTILAAAGTALTTAIATLWKRHSMELDDCKKDRITLFSKVDDLHGKVTNLSENVGEMRGRLGMEKQ